MRYNDEKPVHTVKKSVVATSRTNGDRRRFAEGTHVSLEVAYEYRLSDDQPKVGVRPDGETNATGSDDPIVYAERAEAAAPENRMERAPENRSEQMDPLGELSDEEYLELSPAEKGKRTKAANEAKANDSESEK